MFGHPYLLLPLLVLGDDGDDLYIMMMMMILVLGTESCLSLINVGDLHQPLCLCFFFGDCSSLQDRHKLDQVEYVDIDDDGFQVNCHISSRTGWI